MKQILISIKTLIIVFLLFGCSEDKLPTPPIIDIQIFPSDQGTSYTYNLRFGPPNLITGIKKTHILSKTNKKNNLDVLSIYQPQVDSIIYQENTLVDTTYFRKSSSGVFYFIDTTGFSSLVPDTLRNFLTVDTESRLLFFPLSINQTWPVYQVDIKISGIPVFSPIRAFAKVADMYKTDFVVRNTKMTSNVYKIEYALDIQLSPEGQIERQTAVGFFANGIGFIKWEGQTSVINLVKGNTFTFPSDTLSEDLLNYFIP